MDPQAFPLLGHPSHIIHHYNYDLSMVLACYGLSNVPYADATTAGAPSYNTNVELSAAAPIGATHSLPPRQVSLGGRAAFAAPNQDTFHSPVSSGYAVSWQTALAMPVMASTTAHITTPVFPSATSPMSLSPCVSGSKKTHPRSTSSTLATSASKRSRGAPASSSHPVVGTSPATSPENLARGYGVSVQIVRTVIPNWDDMANNPSLRQKGGPLHDTWTRFLDAVWAEKAGRGTFMEIFLKQADKKFRNELTAARLEDRKAQGKTQERKSTKKSETEKGQRVDKDACCDEGREVGATSVEISVTPCVAPSKASRPTRPLPHRKVANLAAQPQVASTSTSTTVEAPLAVSCPSVASMGLSLAVCAPAQLPPQRHCPPPRLPHTTTLSHPLVASSSGRTPAIGPTVQVTPASSPVPSSSIHAAELSDVDVDALIASADLASAGIEAALSMFLVDADPAVMAALPDIVARPSASATVSRAAQDAAEFPVSAASSSVESLPNSGYKTVSSLYPAPRRPSTHLTNRRMPLLSPGKPLIFPSGPLSPTTIVNLIPSEYYEAAKARKTTLERILKPHVVASGLNCLMRVVSWEGRRDSL